MPDDFDAVFAALKSILAKHEKQFVVKDNTRTEYNVVTKTPSPFPQHKGQPLWFGAVKLGKAYVSYHLVAIYMNKALSGEVSPALKKRMQGKACFNFKAIPEPEIAKDLKNLTDACVKDWSARKWL